MYNIRFEIDSNTEILKLLDESLNHIFIPDFCPRHVIDWWETNLMTPQKVELKNLSVRMLTADVQTNLNGIEQIINLNTQHLSIYQFERQISDTLQIDRLPDNSKEQILKQNGLKHIFLINYEMLIVSSYDEQFIESIINKPGMQDRILSKYST